MRKVCTVPAPLGHRAAVPGKQLVNQCRKITNNNNNDDATAGRRLQNPRFYGHRVRKQFCSFRANIPSLSCITSPPPRTLSTLGDNSFMNHNPPFGSENQYLNFFPQESVIYKSGMVELQATPCRLMRGTIFDKTIFLDLTEDY